MMDEYIKREDALNALLDEMVGTGYQSRAMDAIKFVPTADVVPRSKYDLAVAEREANVKGFAETLKTIKSESVKEFAKRLHKYIDDFREKREMVALPYTEAALLSVEKKIDHLVKEFTEGAADDGSEQ